MALSPAVIALLVVIPGATQFARPVQLAMPTGGLSNAIGLAAVQSVSAPNACISYSYDRNGNILTKSAGTYGQATWGSSAYACFSWTAH